ncbi:peptidoglycan hydrolase involved in the splitting of the septum during cell division [Arthrobacter sp. Hiyo4]|nr:peptidoglycan hydrolase involved in the splitting of the septum during cell division [Arthrobacter sp. Hiyo4]
MLSMTIPAQAGAIASESQGGTAPATASSPKEIPDRTAAPGASAYTVKTGDTLGQIGAWHGISLETILSLNGPEMTSIIHPGTS